MQCKDVEIAVEREGLAPVPEAARTHLAGCRHCRELVEDFAAIVAVAKELSLEVEPPVRVWVRLRAQLEAEEIIKEPVATPDAEPSSWWRGWGDLFRTRALATATVGLLIGFAAFLQIRTDTILTASTSLANPGAAWESIAATRLALSEQEPVARGIDRKSTRLNSSH